MLESFASLEVFDFKTFNFLEVFDFESFSFLEVFDLVLGFLAFFVFLFSGNFLFGSLRSLRSLFALASLASSPASFVFFIFLFRYGGGGSEGGYAPHPSPLIDFVDLLEGNLPSKYRARHVSFVCLPVRRNWPSARLRRVNSESNEKVVLLGFCGAWWGFKGGGWPHNEKFFFLLPPPCFFYIIKL